MHFILPGRPVSTQKLSIVSGVVANYLNIQDRVEELNEFIVGYLNVYELLICIM